MGANRTGSKTGADDYAKRNRESLVRVGLMVAMALLLASSAPPNLVLAVFSGMLFISAAVAAAFAVFMRDDPFAGSFTRWDGGPARPRHGDGPVGRSGRCRLGDRRADD